MRVSRIQLEDLLKENVCEIRFVRRHPPRDGRPMTRRMICTKSYSLLNSVDGRVKLNYRPPRHQSTANPVVQNLVIVWDILMQDYRNVPMEQCEVLEQIPVNKFWKYFNDKLYPMSPGDKVNLMNT